MYDHLTDALIRRFQLGAQPEKRQRFFKKLQALCEVHGEACFRAIKTVAAEAAGKNQPGNWFCAAVLRRLREAGFCAMDSSLDPPLKGATR